MDGRVSTVDYSVETVVPSFYLVRTSKFSKGVGMLVPLTMTGRVLSFILWSPYSSSM